MRSIHIYITIICLAISLLTPGAFADDANTTTLTEFRQYSTMHSLGFEWDMQGDANHNASCTVAYRAEGESDWQTAFDLFRVDSETWFHKEKADRPYNMFAGSILFLQPGTTYDVTLSITDPDGGSTEKTLKAATLPMPTKPTSGKQLHVVPGEAGGSGSEADPYQGIQAALAVAEAGDTILLHTGNYGRLDIEQSGKANNYLVITTAPNAKATFSHIRVKGSWLWFENLMFRYDETNSKGLEAEGDTVRNVVRYCDFQGYNYSITLARYKSSAWYIADNTIVGDKTPFELQHGGGEGIELNRSSHHTVCHNRISRTHDGVSYPMRNCDIFANDIFDIGDDGIEMDFAYSNIRIWNNRILETYNEGFSFQPQFAGPWYLIRNEVVSHKNMLKFRVVCRFVLINNTFVIHHQTAQRGTDMLLKSFSRNNLWIHIPKKGRKPGSVLWNAGDHGRAEDQSAIMKFQYKPDWQGSVDYDGLDWADSNAPILWATEPGNTGRFDNLAEFAEAVGIEKNATRVHRDEIFNEADIMAYSKEGFPERRLTLKENCNAIDAGTPVVHLSDQYTGEAPDLGAYEVGMSPPHIGPRPR